MLDHTFAPIFAALTERMGIPHTTETSGTQRSRVEWSDAGAPSPEPISYKLAGRKVVGRLAWPMQATIYGDSRVEICGDMEGDGGLLPSLLGHLSELVGPPRGCGDAPGHHGYEFKPGKIAGIVGGDGTGAGYVCAVQVTLYTPISAQIHGSATAGPATLSLTPTAGAGLTVESLEAAG